MDMRRKHGGGLRRSLEVQGTMLLVLMMAGCGVFQPGPPSEPTSLEVVAARDGQTAPAGTALPQQVQVRVLDQDGDPYRKGDVQVTWTVLTGGGSATPGSSFPGSSGIASSTWILGPQIGAQTVQASAEGLASVTITATATEGGMGTPGDTLFVGEGTAAAGASTEISVTLSLLAAAGGVQFRIDTSDSLSFTGVTPTGLLDGLTVASNVGNGPGTLTVAVYGSASDTIAAGQGVVLNLSITVAAGTPAGEYILFVTDARISDPAGTTSTPIGRSDGKVIVP